MQFRYTDSVPFYFVLDYIVTVWYKLRDPGFPIALDGSLSITILSCRVLPSCMKRCAYSAEPQDHSKKLWNIQRDSVSGHSVPYILTFPDIPCRTFCRETVWETVMEMVGSGREW